MKRVLGAFAFLFAAWVWWCVILLLAGCAMVRATPTNLANGWTDPERRNQSLERITEGAVGTLTGIGTYALICRSFTSQGEVRGCTTWWQHTVAVGGGIAAGVLSEFLFFEFIAEPAGWGGHYWERNARSGTFRKP